jgi:hypothetical protein
MESTATERIKWLAYLLHVVGFLGAELTLSALGVKTAMLLLPDNLPGTVADARLILDVFVSTLPLSIAVAVIVAAHKSGNLSIGVVVVTLLLSILVGNWFHLGLRPVDFTFSHTEPSRQGWLGFTFGMIQDYWTAYGPVMFVKSCVVGCAFGRWL